MKSGSTIQYTQHYSGGIEYRQGATGAPMIEAILNNNNKVDITTTTTNEVLQENHYYPFGLGTNGAWMNSAASLDNLYQYNGKELNVDWGLNMIDYGARMYMADLGRWGGVDAMPVSYVSTYAYVHNAPLALLDPTGMYAEGSSHTYTDANANVQAHRM